MVSLMLSAHVISKERALSTYRVGDHGGLGAIRNVETKRKLQYLLTLLEPIP
jgi:hypothetical protein